MRAAQGLPVGCLVGDAWQVVAPHRSGSLTQAYVVESSAGVRSLLRVLHPELARIPELTERFLRDPMIANQVRHPGVVRVLDTGIHAGLPFMVSDSFEGRSLAGLIEAGRAPAPADCLKLLCGVLEILDVAHAANIVHRDLRPDSVVVLESGEVRIRDFGFAKLREIGGVAAPLAFVPPERLVHGTAALDARGDLFAVGAIAFLLLSGESPLAASSTNFERPTFSALLPDAPTELAELVDRALMRDPERRFQSAADMYRAARRAWRRPELSEPGPLVSSIRQLKSASAASASMEPERAGGHSERAAGTLSFPPAPSMPSLGEESVAAHAGGSAGRVRHSGTGSDAPEAQCGAELEFVSDDDVLLLREIFTQWERALRGNSQYGAAHPEAVRLRDRAWAAVERALAASDGALLWNLSPYAFSVADEAVWEPASNLAVVPYRLFADGVRVLGFRAGLTREEWECLSDCMLSERDGDALNDFTTVLWDAELPHVVCQTVDVFLEGDGAAREELDAVRRSVIAVAQFDTTVQLRDCWEQVSALSPGNDWQPTYEAGLGANDRPLAELLEADAARLSKLADALAGEQEPRINRFVYVAASGLLHAARSGSLQQVLPLLEQTLNVLGSRSQITRLECAVGLIETAGRDATLRETLVTRMFTPTVVEESVFALEQQPPAQRTQLWQRLSRLLDPSSIGVLGELVGSLSEPDFKREVIEQLVKHARGNEGALGEAMGRSELGVALAVVRALAGLKSEEGHSALLLACQHPEPIVRIEALNALGAPGERVGLEFKQLLEDPVLEVRLSALRAIALHEVRAVGPALALKIRGESFDELVLEERSLAFDALARLMPSRAESVAVELLSRAPLVANRGHDETRELAAKLLGRLAQSQPAEAALEREVGRRFRNSERVREASARALESVRVRRSSAPPVKDTQNGE